MTKHKYIRIVLSIFLFGVILIPKSSLGQVQDWQIEKSKHFIIYYKEVPLDPVNELISKAEYYYKNIVHSLGYKGFGFWTWENRCKIYLYPSRKAYLAVSGSRQWSRAHVNIKEKQINTYIGQGDFFDIILPHELGHIIFREFVGFNKKLPLCLDEGLACFQEIDNFRRKKIAAEIIKKGLYFSLDKIFKIGRSDFQTIKPIIFYSQCFSVMDFLLKRYGRNRFTVFCRRVRDGENWEDALIASYRFRSLEELEIKWINFLGEEFGS
ncbi:MAG: hypothetical protein K9L71_03605 [Candidatus Omnitrophica bacterium]|nr:hypothetical protein [Candidatus Omnitrophota bacterium]